MTIEQFRTDARSKSRAKLASTMPSRDGRRPIGQPAELRKLLAELW